MADEHHDILGIRIDDLSLQALTEKLNAFIEGAEARVVVTPNPEFILAAQDDPELRSVLAKADLSLPDGIGLKFAVAALYDDERLEFRHTGVDTFRLLAQLAARNAKRLLILGGTGRDPEIVAEMFKKDLPDLDVVACDPGIIDDELPRLNEATVAKLKLLEPVVIAVALGQGRGQAQGKQEKILEFLKHELGTARVLIGVGGAVHMLANPHLQAPESWRRRGFEWLWRLLKQPWRFKRILRAAVIFPLEVVWATLRKHRFWRAVKNVFRELRKI